MKNIMWLLIILDISLAIVDAYYNLYLAAWFWLQGIEPFYFDAIMSRFFSSEALIWE